MADGSVGTPYYKRRLDERIDPKWRQFSWLTLRALASSVNDVIAKGAGTLVNDRRARWVAAQRDRGGSAADVLDLTPRGTSFIVIGDTGEADDSQYAVVDPLLNEHERARTAFMLIASDVVYPAGDVNDYVNALYVPYREYTGPIYAIPGNHDWYDGLEGFMFHFCGAEPLPPVEIDPASYGARERIWRRLWQRASAPNRPLLHYHQRLRARTETGPDAWIPPRQPGPYFAIRVGPLVVACIDTGVTGEIDAEQADWLLELSRLPDPKLLVTGKPLYVNNEPNPGRIARWLPELDQGRHACVDEIVRDPDHRYVAAIGGDIHNYQRYEDNGGELPPFTYLVSGGGGAYLGATHGVEVELDGNEPALTVARRTYPSPSESLRVYARTLVPEIWRTIGRCGAFLLGLVVALVVVLLESKAGWAWPALAVAALVVAAGLRSRFDPEQASGRRRRYRLELLVIGLAGVAATLGLRAAAGDHDWRSGDAARPAAAALVCVAIPLAVAFLVGWYAREHGDDETAPTHGVVLGWVAAGILALAGIVGLVGVEASRSTATQAALGLLLLGLLAVPPVVDRLLERVAKRHRFVRAHHGVLLLLPVTFVVAAYVTYALFWPRAALTFAIAVAALLYVPIALVFSYRLHRATQDARVWAILANALILAIVVAIAYATEWWWLRFLAGLLCGGVVILFLLTVVYLHWMGGFALLRHGRDRSGTLSAPAAEQFLAWRRQRAERPPRADYEIAVMVSPSRKRGVGSPVHALLAEIFEPQEPGHLYKSYLRVDVGESEVTITCFGVTGASRTAEPVDRVTLPYPPPRVDSGTARSS